MIITQGRHKGKTAEMVFFQDPYYVKLLLEYANPDGLMPEIRKEIIRLMAVFNRKEFVCKCEICKSKPAIALAFDEKTLSFTPWCFYCWLPEFKDEEQKKLISFYQAGLMYVDKYWPDSSEHYRMIIRNISVMKGLPELFSVEDVERFFFGYEGNDLLNPKGGFEFFSGTRSGEK